MSNTGPTTWRQRNQYNAHPACEHCSGIRNHEPWCMTLNPFVRYAFLAVVEPTGLTIGDTLILHSLGVSWTRKECQRNCTKIKN